MNALYQAVKNFLEATDSAAARNELKKVFDATVEDTLPEEDECAVYFAEDGFRGSAPKPPDGDESKPLSGAHYMWLRVFIMYGNPTNAEPDPRILRAIELVDDVIEDSRRLN